MIRNLKGREIILTNKTKISGIFGKVLSEDVDDKYHMTFSIIISDKDFNSADKGSFLTSSYCIKDYDVDHYVLSGVERSDFKVIDDEDEIPSNNSVSPVSTFGDDLSLIDKYLTKDQQCMIYERVFTAHLESKMDEILGNIREIRGKSLIDICLEKAVDKYTDGLSEELQDTLQKKLEEIINDPSEGGESFEDTFKSGARHHLIDMCGVYIQHNSEMFTELMKDRIIETAEHITDDKFIDAMKYKLYNATNDAIGEICKSVKGFNKDTAL